MMSLLISCCVPGYIVVFRWTPVAILPECGVRWQTALHEFLIASRRRMKLVVPETRCVTEATSVKLITTTGFDKQIARQFIASFIAMASQAD